ncbi:hypothetical protein ACI77O_12680 [Pseudomonas tritici]|uniref:hypothetical protein n=1 Tax=Pseudomonas tritici TaxID=2745518 RepID=UPI00387AD5AB
MLPSHLLRMINVCLNGNYDDPGVREHIKLQCIPYLNQHRREVLAGSYSGRHQRPSGFISKKVSGTMIIRRAVAQAHKRLVAHSASSNVLSFSAAAKRRGLLAAS